MKRLRRVSASYIPDMTERYPEGMSNVSDFDAIEEFSPYRYDTLDSIIGDIRADVREGEYYNRVRVIQDGKEIYDGHKIDDVCKLFSRLDNIFVRDYTWFNDVITIIIW